MHRSLMLSVGIVNTPTRFEVVSLNPIFLEEEKLDPPEKKFFEQLP